MAATSLWIVLLPFLAFLVQVSIGKRLPRHGDWVSLGAIFGSFLLACPIFFSLVKNGQVYDTLNYAWMVLPQSIGGSHPAIAPFQIEIGVLINNLTAIMLFMVTLCSTLIHLFATGYMHGEERYHLFFAYISLFSSAMLGLVISDNLLTFFICWELMGLCSYLLIGFYYKKQSAMNASLKAFMTTRVGDTGLFLGICGIFAIFGTSKFEVLYKLATDPQIQTFTILGVPALIFIGLMIMMGTIGKSAQFPLHVWLPDAMEGPTPVSALIHAATMVAAGVFLLIRTYPLLAAAPGVLTVISYVGAGTAFLAALLAFVQVDIKKVLAYSTISQLGFMVFGVGVGAFSAAFMHLLTHACFKACLFLCSGSVIHSVHTQDMREMGGLRSKMPITFLCMLISTLAISGMPFFSGFVSKDAILAGALAHSMLHGHWLIPILGFCTAGMTAFYMFRLIFMTFFGHARDEHKHHHAHEQPLTMTIPLMVLALLSFSIFWAGPTGISSIDQIVPVTWYETALANAQHSMGIVADHSEHAEHAHHTAHNLAMILSLTVAGLGILLSALFYLKHVFSAEKFKNMIGPVYGVLVNLYYFDFLYINIIIQKILLPFEIALAKFDDLVIDRIFVDGWKDVTMAVKGVVGKFDDIVVDRTLVDGTAGVMALGGWFLRLAQTGRVQQYLIAVFFAFGIALVFLM